VLTVTTLLHLSYSLFDNVLGSYFPVKAEGAEGREGLSGEVAPMVSVDCFRLAFASYRDGASLEALYSKCRGCGPTVILVKALRSQAVVGAFVSASLGPPFGEAKGDVDSFAFRLDGDAPAFYPTVALEEGMADLEPYRQVALTYARQQFVRCAKSQLSLGLSVGRAPSHVLRINEDLGMCWCGPSETYGNRYSLVPEDSPFPVDTVEVWVGPFAPVEPEPPARSVDVSQLAGGGTVTLYDDEDEAYFESPTFANLGSWAAPEATAAYGLQHLQLMANALDDGVLDGAHEDALDQAMLRAQKIARQEAAYWEQVEYQERGQREDQRQSKERSRRKSSPWIHDNEDRSETSSRRSDHGINVAKRAHSPAAKRSSNLLARRSSAVVSNAHINNYEAAILAAKASLGVDAGEGEAVEVIWEAGSLGHDGEDVLYSDGSDDLDIDDFLRGFDHDDEDDRETRRGGDPGVRSTADKQESEAAALNRHQWVLEQREGSEVSDASDVLQCDDQDDVAIRLVTSAKQTAAADMLLRDDDDDDDDDDGGGGGIVDNAEACPTPSVSSKSGKVFTNAMAHRPVIETKNKDDFEL